MMPLPDQQPSALVLVQVKLLDGQSFSSLAIRRFDRAEIFAAAAVVIRQLRRLAAVDFFLTAFIGELWQDATCSTARLSAGRQPLVKDRDALLAFYDFPAEHWKHLRTTNVIESSFATVRRSKGCLSNRTALAMIFKLAEAAEKSWRRLNGHSQLPKVIFGVKFTDGIEVVTSQAQAAAA
jgi:hypothetical protein